MIAVLMDILLRFGIGLPCIWLWLELHSRMRRSAMFKSMFLCAAFVVSIVSSQFAYAQATKLIVAYASPAATFCPGWIARREGIFARYGLDVEMVLMQGASV